MKHIDNLKKNETYHHLLATSITQSHAVVTYFLYTAMRMRRIGHFENPVLFY